VDSRGTGSCKMRMLYGVLCLVACDVLCWSRKSQIGLQAALVGELSLKGREGLVRSKVDACR
jgi:hypothetical protein